MSNSYIPVFALNLLASEALQYYYTISSTHKYMHIAQGKQSVVKSQSYVIHLKHRFQQF